MSSDSMLLSLKSSAIYSNVAGGAMYGLGAGIIGGLSTPLVDGEYFSGDSESIRSIASGALTSCILLGAFFGAFAGVYVGEHYGRLKGFRLAGGLCAVSSVALACAPNFAWIVVLRSIVGMSIGVATALCPWYVTEALSIADGRGSVATVFQLCICGFIFVSELINYGFQPEAQSTDANAPVQGIESWKWRLQLGLSALPGLVLFGLSYIMRESPVYEDEQRVKHAHALESSTTEYVPVDSMAFTADAGQTALRNIGADGTQSISIAPAPTGISWGELFTCGNSKWLLIGLLLSFINQLTGINAVIFYAPAILKDAAVGSVNPLLLAAFVVGGWNLGSVVIAFTLVDRLPRRTLLLSSLIGMTIGAALLSLSYQYLDAHTTPTRGPIAIIGVIFYIGSFEFGAGPLFFLLAVEIFPASMRTRLLSYTQSLAWMMSVGVVFGFPVLQSGVGAAGTFLIFSLNAAAAGICVFLALPESGGTATSSPETTMRDTDDITKQLQADGMTSAQDYQKL